MRKAFTLVEVLIVVAILGILAAVVLPQFRSHTAEATSAAAKDTLRVLRNVIEFYTVQHEGTPPGYYNDQLPLSFLFEVQLIYYTDATGNATGSKSADYPYGPYLRKIPENPLNDKATVKVLSDAESFPESADGSFGWIYKRATKEIRLDYPGTDRDGIRYYDY